ncbi:hypothetical protein Q4596_01370 [Pseudoalteromonas carrageenovora]|uniref:hypothetical protein n=1 Tax=Pseudoalteromonas carrageenovora TaxID=227 RepID=UPI0026E1C3C1|nr:hypothetical protein [Pseudoalteromonas carrageenovora]MDO6834249.1 hypothetical protein [Pseudoalteromonas carrageenovora]
MNTIVKDWQIVSVLDKGELVGDVLWGICVDDSTYRFSKGDYICTSLIVKTNEQLIKTVNGSTYQTLGEGTRCQVLLKDFELLRHGFSPQQIEKLNQTRPYQLH